MSQLSQFLARVKLKSEKLTSTASQTIFTLSSVTIPGPDQESLLVIINGKKQPLDAYTVDSSTQITISEGLEAGDIVEVIVTSY